MSLANSLEQCFAFEDNLESGFAALLPSVGISNVASSREGRPIDTPQVNLWFTNGETLLHQHAFPDGRLVWDTFTGVLTTEIITNKSDDLAKKDHALYLAKFRKAMQMFRLVPLWPRFQNISLIVDIREGGTLDTWEDEQNLDHSTIIWNVRHCINPEAWPTNIDA